MREHHFITSRTARYCTLGELNESTKEILLVLHGYAQLAKDFIEDFKILERHDRFIIAPEGLSRFYAKGFGGNPVASWMTSEDRLSEIKDYTHFIEELMQMIVPKNYEGQLSVLGFSQGVATGTRWLHATKMKVDKLIIYAGQIGAELTNPYSEKLLQLRIVYITGTKDPFLTLEIREKVYLQMNELNAEIIEFDGGHEINPEVIKRIFI
jgi:predicted esterase